MIECLSTGLVYRNPKPYMRAVHAWHPSLVCLRENELVAAFDLGQAVESLDYRTYVCRSTDGGATWSEPVRMFEDPVPRRSVHTVRINRLSDGALIAMGGRIFRDDPEVGIINRENLGYVETELIVLRSHDEGRTWEGPETVRPSLPGGRFEICHSVVELADGRLLFPTAMFKTWEGEAPYGVRAVALVSHDKGETWPEHLDVIDQYDRGLTSWEQSLRQLPDGRLLAVCWALNEGTGRSEPTPYALSEDGCSFSAPRPTGLRGQTAKIHPLSDGRILCLYRRDDRPGLWANLSRMDGDRWVDLEEAPIWQGAQSGMVGEGASADELGALKFGFPGMVTLPGGDIMGYCWCCEDCVYGIRWFRIRVA